MNHTDRPLSEKISQVRKFCEKFNEEQTRYVIGPYVTNYASKDGEIIACTSDSSSYGIGFVIRGVHTRESIISMFIDYFSLYPGNQKDGTTGL